MESVCPRRRGHETAALPASSLENTLAKTWETSEIQKRLLEKVMPPLQEFGKVRSVRLVDGWGVRIPIKLRKLLKI